MRHIVYYLVPAAILFTSALFTNCQKSTTPAPAAPSRAPQAQTTPEDDEIVHTFAPAGKVQIKQKSLINAPQLLARARAAGRALKASATAVGIAEGTSLLVVLDRACPITARSLAGSTLSETVTRVLPELRIQAFKINLKEAKLADELSEEAEADPCVLHIENNERVSIGPVTAKIQGSATLPSPNDPLFSQLSQHALIESRAAWDTFFSPGRGINQTVLVAIVDTGVDSTHPDLAANMWVAGDGTRGINLVAANNDPMDDNGHGTHVAGLIGAAANNGVGVTGIMGKNIKIMPIKALNAEGSGEVTDIVNGMRWAADHGADVLNMSVGAAGASQAFADALNYVASKNVVVAVAAGNDGHQLTTSAFTAPAGYCVTTPGTIAVGSVDTATDLLSSFSNYSTTYVGIAAPGSENSASASGLISTYPKARYARLEGTSMASPVVAGSLALIVGIMKSNNIPVVNSTVVSLLKASAKINAGLSSQIAGGSELNLERLARTLRYRYMIDSDGGTEAIQ